MSSESVADDADSPAGGPSAPGSRQVGWNSRYDHPVDWSHRFEARSVPDMLLQTATRYPGRTFIHFEGRNFTYGEIADRASEAAEGFRRLGVERGVNVGLFLPNCPHYVVAYYGIMMAGGTVVNFSPLYTADELAFQAEDAHVDTMVCLDLEQLFPAIAEVQARGILKTLIVGNIAEVLPPLKSLAYRLFRRGDRARIGYGRTRLRYDSLFRNGKISRPAAIAVSEDIALIQYTGGTTGRPKGALLTHANLSINAAQVHAVDPEPGNLDRILGALPLFHVFANTCVLNRSVLAGDEVILIPKFDLDTVLKLIPAMQITTLPGVPTMYRAMLDHPDIANYDLTSLRICISGGAPMPAELRSAFVKKTGAAIAEGYGLTESSGVVSVNPYLTGGKPGSIGHPLPGTQIIIADREDPHHILPQGEHGEITVRGPQIMRGYWGRPEKNEDTFVDGRLRTGDVGYLDADGYGFIVDRMKDLILVGGFNVYPSTLEAELYRHEAVKEAIVIGIDDKRLGQRPKAFVVLEEGAEVSEAVLLSYLNEHVGKHERAAALEIRAELPKTMIGKLSRKELVDEERAKSASCC
ncbi:long-chain fatty acid--CoA ligase [Pacificimonas sp. WHA3]|uniref:Long-chain fatty acid--CoA ligase n=1 Tax=Pacificimonas pallii TaxID=2827236 RepID=A0ABS6SCH4_9SPHN|nr:long-chain fatty acid--CoA ligase [Pacificimonas pallii]MBV7256084.1 long-chain fatty acid--CoA ligase [Pacificimonas pallii]